MLGGPQLSDCEFCVVDLSSTHAVIPDLAACRHGRGSRTVDAQLCHGDVSAEKFE